MRILIVIRSLGFGGAERQVVELAKGLHFNGNNVTVATFYPGGALGEELRREGVRVVSLDKKHRWDLFGFFIRLLRLARSVRPDVVYPMLPTENVVATFLRPFLPRAMLVFGMQSASVPLERYDRLTRLIYRCEAWLSRMARLVIANSQAGIEHAIRRGFPREKLGLLRNPTDCRRFAPDPEAGLRVRRRWNIPAEARVIGMVARLDPVKDHPTFLRAAASLMARGQQPVFVCVGEGPQEYSRQMAELASKLGLDGSLLWIAPETDIAAIYNSFDIMVLSSMSEGSPNVVTEAMACGVPCVVTNVGDAPQVVQNLGWVVPPQNPEALASAMVAALQTADPSLREKVRARILDRFEPRRVIESLESLLRKARRHGAGDADTGPIRILHGLTTGGFGGTELMVLSLVELLDRGRFAVEVSLLDGWGPVATRLEAMGIPVHDLRASGGALQTFRRLRRLLAARRYHVLHLYGFRMSLLGRVAARVVRPRPVVIHGIRGLHVTEGEEVSSLWTRIAIAVERAAAPLVDAYVANSHGAVTFLGSRGIPKGKFIVIPNGVAVSRDDGPSSRRDRDIPEIICVANFRPIKRHVDLIDAVALLHGRGVRFRCLLVGDGMSRPRVETLARERHLTGVIEFLGSREPQDVQALLQRADVFVLPSLWEGMPVTVMEAMASGCPVVGTNVPGIRELVVDGVTGYLAPPKSPEALAGRLEQLLEDPVLRTRMGEAGRLRIIKEFSLEQMVRRHEEVYTSLCHGRFG